PALYPSFAVAHLLPPTLEALTQRAVRDRLETRQSRVGLPFLRLAGDEIRETGRGRLLQAGALDGEATQARDAFAEIIACCKPAAREDAPGARSHALDVRTDEKRDAFDDRDHALHVVALADESRFEVRTPVR